MSVALRQKPKAVKTVSPPWWQGGVIYQLYVRSFYDSNGDGVGDLRGVIMKLDYIKSLGIDAIWLSPVTVSGNADWGYDVIDYKNIDPDLGTMEDFDELLQKAKSHGIKIITDLVPNHTSTKHPWFQNALTGRNAKYRDYYIWANPKKRRKPPSNWKSYFGGSAWTYHPPTKQFYLHNFLPEQAELNWRNPKVLDEFDDIMRFWLDKGVAGFRIDVFNMLIKDERFRDNPKAGEEDGIELRLLGQKPTYNVSQPEVHSILKRWRKITDSYPEKRLLLGETTLVFDVTKIATFYGKQDELDMAFNFGFTQSQFNAGRLKEIVSETELSIKNPDWPVWTSSNHDTPRFPSRWAKNDERKIRCALMLLMCLRGTPVLYYGDELGMPGVFVPPWRLKDPRGKRFWPVDFGRDQARTPMPWKNKVGAGFTPEDVRPWLPYGDLRKRSVEVEERRESTLKYTRDLIKLRHKSDDLKHGDYKLYDTASSVWVWKRGKKTTIAINMSNYRHEIEDIKGEIRIATVRRREGKKIEGRLLLAPWEGVVIIED